jgi:[ribosomal protein S5]-alanine N-acetyltransferase
MSLFAAFDRKQNGLSDSRISLREPQTSHFAAWCSLRAESADFLVPWEPRWPSDDLTREGFRRRLRRYRRDGELGVATTWFLFRDSDDALLGGLTYSGIRYGASCSAQLGYWMGVRHAGQGYMTSAVHLSLGEMFTRRGMERIEAACIPENRRSIRLLQRNGFVREGYLRSYLEINGERRDHILFALLRENHSPLAPRGAPRQDEAAIS